MIKFTRLKAENTFSYKSLDFNFETGLHSIQGTNGSSKTSLFLTLQHGLFNRNAKGCKVDEVNNLITGKPSVVEVTFNVDQTTYKVVNSRKDGNIKVWKDGHDISLKRIPDNLKLIEEILGCDFQTFSDRTYQSKSSSINLLDSSTNKGRAEFVNNICKLSELDAHLDRLASERKALESKGGRIALLKASIENAKASFSEGVAWGEALPVAELEDRIVSNNKKLDQYAEAKTALSIELAETSAKVLKAKKARLTIDEIASKGSQLSAIVAPDKPQEECADQYAKISAALATRQEVRRQLAKELSDMEAANSRRCCPTCKQGVPAGTFDSQIADLKVKYAEAEAFIIKCGKGMVKYKERLGTWALIRKLKKELEVLEASITDAEEADPEDEEVLKVAMSILVSSSDTCRQELQADRNELTRVLEHNARVAASVELNKKIAESNKLIKKQVEKLSAELEECCNRVELLKTWIGILGPKGYRTAKISAFLTDLNKTMSRYSKLICDGKIKCRFYVNEEGEIDFTIADGDKEMDIALWSGGETSRIKMVCLFAVLEILEVRGTSSFNVLCLDEIFSTLDSQGKEGLFNILGYLKGKGTAIYTISHEDIALDLVYDSTILARKCEDGTTEITQ